MFGRFVFLALLVVAAACARVEACLLFNEYETRVGDTLLIISCSPRAESFVWQIDDGAINNFLPLPNAFYNHYAVAGGSACADSVALVFTDTGEYVLRLEAQRLRGGTCDVVLETAATDEVEAIIRVRP